jgi:enoyl-CoA hydratase/carnithine racemase
MAPQPISAATAAEWGVVAHVVDDGKAVETARALATQFLGLPDLTRRNTRIHFMQPLKERIVREVGYGLALEGAGVAALVQLMAAQAAQAAP